MKNSPNPDLLIDFSSADEIARWSAANDVVMGGISRGGILATSSGTALFAGFVSLDSGGGFASVRSDNQTFDLEGCRDLRLRVRGDGKRYHLRVRTSTAQDGISYLAPFETQPDSWFEVSLRSEDFRPSWRGSVIETAPALSLADVQSFGFLIADGQAGSFALEIAWIAKR